MPISAHPVPSDPSKMPLGGRFLRVIGAYDPGLPLRS